MTTRRTRQRSRRIDPARLSQIMRGIFELEKSSGGPEVPFFSQEIQRERLKVNRTDYLKMRADRRTRPQVLEYALASYLYARYYLGLGKYLYLHRLMRKYDR